jgi:trehalose synthase-fused probable maltokinase
MSGNDDALPRPEALAAWIAGQRWFAAKTRRIRGAGVADSVRLGHGVVLLVDVELDDGNRERYALPLVPGDEIRDALGEAEFCRALLALLAGGGTAGGERGEIRGVPAGGLPESWAGGIPASLSVRRLGGEQSNSSVALGEALVLKHFRKLAVGVNPEAEMTRFLTERTSFRHTPRLVGHLEYRDAEARTTTLAVIQELVADARDGWQWVLAQLADPARATAAVAALRRLGERTGELHRALASDPRDPAFAPEAITAADVAAWTDGVAAQIGAAHAALGGEPVSVDLAAVRRGLSPAVGRQKIRHHGDFHLGQTLYRPAAGDWTIIDFEGEPLRPLDERRRKHVPLRDVAGLLRSLDYAAASAPTGAVVPEDWNAQAGQAFVEGYHAAAGTASFLPESDVAFRSVVAVFELEKAAYEIVYEANNRPDWIAIPKRGLLSAAARLGREAAGAA